MDFLSITRLEEGQIVPVISQFSLSGLLEDLRSEADGLLKKGQTLVFTMNLGHQDMRSDKNILRNILYNLVSNAIKYSDEGKTITCQGHVESDRLIMDIRDQGYGIPPEDQKHIGTRFFRASNAVNIPGTGLGLNIVQSYLHALNGELTFVSEQGIGTTFTVSLPLHYEK